MSRSELPFDSAVATGKGDDGTTGLLFGGPRIRKDDLRTEAYGTVDETVAALGLARAELHMKEQYGVLSPNFGGLGDTILRLQRELFVAGADLATNPRERAKLKPEVSLVTAGMVDALEALIDTTVEAHPLPQEFVVPGADPVAAAIDVSRTAVRRAERRAVELADQGRTVGPDAIRYLNRLSDLLFALARQVAGEGDVPSRERGRPGA